LQCDDLYAILSPKLPLTVSSFTVQQIICRRQQNHNSKNEVCLKWQNEQNFDAHQALLTIEEDSNLKV
jgi:hypothetical protein